MSRRRKLFVAIIGSITLLVLFITFVLPGIIRSKAVEGIANATGRRTSIERVAINPFTLRARVDGFRLAESDGKGVFASFSTLSVRVSTASIVHRALVVGDLTLTRPQINLVRVGDNRYNFSDIVERMQKQPKSGGGSHFSLNNIRIASGSLDFDDRAARLPARHKVRELNLAIPFISNIPYLADRYVTPHFAAVVNDAPLTLAGKLKPLAKSAETSLTLKLDKLDLPHYLAYLPFEPGFAMPKGRLSTDLELAYRVGAKDKPELNISGTLGLTGVGFTEKGGAPLLAFKEVSARINRLGVFGGEADLAQVKLDGIDLHLDRDRQGVWNYARLVVPADKRTAKAPPEKATAKKDSANRPPVKVALLSLTNSQVHYRDALVQPGFASDLNRIDFQLKDFATSAKEPAQWRFSCAGDGGEQLAANGTVGATPLTASAELKLAGVRLERYYPYLAEQLTAPVRGVAGVSGKLSYRAEAGIKLSDTNLTVTDLLVPFGASDQLALKSVAVTNASLDLKERQALVGNVSIERGRIALAREADGALSVQKLLKKPAAARPAPPAAAATPTKPFSYTVREFGIKGVDAVFTDRRKEDAPSFTLTGISTTLKNITGPKFAAIPFALKAGYGKEGRLAVSGSAVPDPFRLKGEVVLSRIPLRDFEAYYPEDLDVFIAGGTLDTRLTLDLAKMGEKITGSYGGSLGVRSFYALDTDESEDLLKWESLQIENVRGTLDPFSLAIKDVALTSPFARVIVNKDGSLNLQHLKRSPAGGGSAAAHSAPGPVTGAPAVAKGPAPVSIDAVTIQDGTLAFIDRKLPGGFDSTFYNLGGRVSGLSSEASRFAAVDLRGALENRSPLKISGVINPLRGDLFADLTIAFTGIELSPVTPYSGTYLGYGIDKGKLFLDLKYRIENKKLEAQNKVFIDQLTFGKKVESEKATNLPVRLAVALLKDNNGEIHLDLPVTGRTDDPQFNVWKVALQMFKNLLVKAASSPFSLISSLVGSGEDMSAISFAPGSARLTAVEQEKLGKLARVLKERPAVSLEMSGYVDRRRDPEGYRHEQLERKVRGEKFLSLVKSRKNAPGDTPDTITVSADEYPLYLKSVYRNEDFPKPRNAVGMIKDLPGPDMEKLILANIAVGEKELQQLARERAAAVQSYLKERSAMPLERLFLKGGDPFKGPERQEQVASRVELGVVAK